jgi:putative ABC transport system permease protein
MRTFRQISPILAALRSHKTAVTLLVLEIALTMAILGNLVFIVYDTIQRSHTPTGVAESQIGLIQSIGVIGQSNPGTINEDLITLRGVPGVVDATYGGPPLWYVQRDPVFLDRARTHSVAHIYEFQGSQGLSETLGVHAIEGSGFNDDTLLASDHINRDTVIPVLMTKALAAHLFPGGRALGHLIYDGGSNPMRVIGIVDHLRGEITGRVDDDFSVLSQLSAGPGDGGGGFMIRAHDAAQLPHVLHAAAVALQKANPGHVQNKLFTMSELRAKYFRGDLATGRMLVAIILILLVVTALGVSGLASFWVQQRRRQIGVRRALGATRGDILRYFQMENFLIVGGGVLLGVFFAYALNLFLMHRFELAHLPANYLLVGATTLWLLGQLAVLGPALRAAAVPPVVATRSV